MSEFRRPHFREGDSLSAKALDEVAAMAARRIRGPNVRQNPQGVTIFGDQADDVSTSYGCQNGTESGLFDYGEGTDLLFSLDTQYDHTSDVSKSAAKTVDGEGAIYCMEFSTGGEYMLEARVFGCGSTTTVDATRAAWIDIVKIDPDAQGRVVPIVDTQVEGHFHIGIPGELVSIQPVSIAAGDVLTIRLDLYGSPVGEWSARLTARNLP